MADFDNLKGNSFKYRESQQNGDEKAKKVTTGKVQIVNDTDKKETGFKKFASAFVANDLKTVKNYLIWDVGIPWLKKGALDMFHKGVDKFFGGNYSNNNNRNNGNGAYVSYGSQYSGNATSVTPYRKYDPNRQGGLSTITARFDSREDAEAVLFQMNDILGRFNIVKVSDFYESCGMPTEYTWHRYGWTDISSARVDALADGFEIRMPRPILL